MAHHPFCLRKAAHLSSIDKTRHGKSPVVAVVMSTYNGAEHVKDQLDSIFDQILKPDYVIVRDDGSSDRTLDSLRPYASTGAIQLVEGINLGVVGSFLDGLAHVPAGVDFVFLSDQDDVWHKDKISRAIALVAGFDQSKPLYYCAEYTFCDAQMHKGERSHLLNGDVDLSHLMYENPTSGNTCLINRVLLDIVVSAGSKDVYCHDWWLALVASALGSVVHDDFDCLDYRRTGSNASPTGMSFFGLLRYRINTFFKKGDFDKISSQLNRLFELYGQLMIPSNRAKVQRFVRGNRFSKAVTPYRLRQKLTDELALRLFFLFGLL